MEINTQNILQSSATLFSILNHAQQQENDLVENVAILGIAEKTEANADTIRGQIIDMLV